MAKNTKKIIAAVIAVMMLIGAASCGNVATPGPQAPPSAPDQGMRTVKFFGNDYRHVPWLNANLDLSKFPAAEEFFDLIAQRGLRIEWETVPNESYQMTLNTRLASGDKFAHMYNVNFMSDGDAIRYGRDGVFLDLREAFAKYNDGSIISFTDQYYPGKLNIYTTEDGKLYWYPYLYTTKWVEGGTYDGGTWTSKIRLDWLNQIGFEHKYEVSIDELYTILKAFKDQNVNGQGNVNIGAPFTNFNNFATAGIGDGFGIYASGFEALGTGIERKNGVKEWGFVWESKFIAEYLSFLNSLYEAGIWVLDLLNDGAEVQMRNENRGAMCYDYSASVWEENEVLGVENVYYAPIKLYFMDLANAKMQSDEAAGSVHKNVVAGNLTDEETKACIDLVAFFYSDDYCRLHWNGTEGIGFEYDEYGTRVNLFNPEYPQDADNFDAPLALTIGGNVLPMMSLGLASTRKMQEVDIPKWTEDNNIKAFFDYEYRFVRPKAFDWNRHNLPYAVPTEAESAILERVSETLSTYSRELFLSYIIGDAKIDDLQKYIDEMYSLGLQDYKEVMSARYDRVFNK